VGRLEAAGLPVVVTGDFNTPSHRDWTEATAGLRDHVLPVEWPVTSLRRRPAWWTCTGPSTLILSQRRVDLAAARPKAGSYNPGRSGRPADRIDMTFASADITAQSAEILGEQSADVTDIVVEPWPTDHRAVVSELRVPLGDPGPYVSPVRRLVDQSDVVDLLVAGSHRRRRSW